MKSHFLTALAVAGITFLPVSCTDERSPGEKDSGDTIYITNTFSGWSEGDEVNVNGKTVRVEVIDSMTARVNVSREAEYRIMFPADASFSGGVFTGSIPSVQKDGRIFIGTDCIRRMDFPFQTASLHDAAAHISVNIRAVGSLRPTKMTLTPIDGRPAAGKISVDPDTWKITTEGTDGSVAAECGGAILSGSLDAPDRFCFSVLPGSYPGGFRLIAYCQGGKTVMTELEEGVELAPGATVTLHDAELRDSDLVSLKVKVSTSIKGTAAWHAGTALMINGTTAYAESAEGGVLTFPVSRADSYTAYYPVEACNVTDGAVSLANSPSQPYWVKAPDTDPLLMGTGNGEELTLSQANGIIRVKMYTDPGITRKIRSFRLEASGLSRHLVPEGVLVSDGNSIEVTPASPIKEGVNLESDYTSFSVNVFPGTYRNVKLYVTAFDASFQRPDELTEEDLLVTTEYELGDITVNGGAVTNKTVTPKVEYYDWIRSNGTPHIGGQPYEESVAGFIDTGWLTPHNREHSIEYEVTVSEATYDYRVQKVIFGAYGNNSNKPVALIYSQSGITGWYYTIANVAGQETYAKAEQGSGKVFHIDRGLADKRTVRIGTEGKFGVSYLYGKYKNLDAGDTGWTDLYDERAYFKFTDGNLRCVYPVILFANNNKNSIMGATSEVRIHHFSITYDGKLERDMYPCTVDGIPGMHDKSYNIFYFNAARNVLVVTKNGCYSPMEVGGKL